MKLKIDEKKILNTLFKDVSGTTRDRMLMVLYAAKPERDGSADAEAIIKRLNGLIAKVYNAKPEELEEIFAGIPYDVE